MYTIDFLEKVLKLTEIKVKNNLNLNLKLSWKITPNNRIQLISNRDEPKNFLSLFELINWLSNVYNLREVKDFVQEYNSNRKFPKAQAFAERMGAIDIKLIIQKVYELGAFTQKNLEKIQLFMQDLKKDKLCTYSDCYSFAQDLYAAIKREAEEAKSMYLHNSLEKYAKGIRSMILENV